MGRIKEEAMEKKLDDKLDPKAKGSLANSTGCG
jgi:hypothetical protein